ncbi:MAG TPA: hypothetical protein VF789_12825 [Thermoanaerobaculia bacterium]
MKIQTPSTVSGARASLALLVVMSLLVLLATPLCATEACPMGEHAEQAGCDPLDGGCCQTPGSVPSADAPLQVLPPALAASPPVDAEAGVGIWPVLQASLVEAVALPAILQGVGLHAFLEVFLI